MQTVIKQRYSKISQAKMAQIEPDYWLRLLGGRNYVNGSARFGHNGHQVGVQALASQVMMLDHGSDYWLRLLSGTGQSNHTTNNGRIAKMAPQALGNQQFTPEHWLRLLGDTR